MQNTLIQYGNDNQNNTDLIKNSSKYLPIQIARKFFHLWKNINLVGNRWLSEKIFNSIGNKWLSATLTKCPIFRQVQNQKMMNVADATAPVVIFIHKLQLEIPFVGMSCWASYGLGSNLIILIPKNRTFSGFCVPANTNH